MKLKMTLVLAALAIGLTGCGQVESHSRMLTHPPRVFGEYVTQTAKTVDFTTLTIPVFIPGRRPEYGSYPLKDNVILTNRRNVIDVQITNPFDDVLLGPHVITVTFHDGPEGADLEALVFESGVIGPGRTVKASLATTVSPPQGTYFWSYSVDRVDDWEAALQAYNENRQSAQETEDESGSGGDDEWDEEW